MALHSLDKEDFVLAESRCLPVSGSRRKAWQTPKLLDFDFSKTNDSLDDGDDGLGGGS